MVSHTNFHSRSVVVLFEDWVAQELVYLSSQIQKKIPSHVILKTRDSYPHLTIYSTMFPKENLEKIDDILIQSLKSIRPFTLKLTSKSCMAGVVFVNAELSPELYSLHEKIVDRLNPLRQGAFDQEELNLPGLTEAMRHSLIKYGMWAAKEIYMPHVTVGEPIEPGRCGEALELLPDTIDYTMQIQEVSLVDTGPHGVCKSILETFSLKA